MRRTAAILGLLLWLAGGLAACAQEEFAGSRAAAPDAYMLDIERMTGTDRHTLVCKRGDVLAIRFETVKGALYLEIQAPDKTVLYAGNGSDVTDFTVGIAEDGAYSVLVEARRAEGRISIRKEGQTS